MQRVRVANPAALQGEQRAGEGNFAGKNMRKLSVLHLLFTWSFLHVVNIQSFLKIQWLDAQVASARVQMETLEIGRLSREQNISGLWIDMANLL